jgi:hypothetical protein
MDRPARLQRLQCRRRAQLGRVRASGFVVCRGSWVVGCKSFVGCISGRAVISGHRRSRWRRGSLRKTWQRPNAPTSLRTPQRTNALTHRRPHSRSRPSDQKPTRRDTTQPPLSTRWFPKRRRCARLGRQTGNRSCEAVVRCAKDLGLVKNGNGSLDSIHRGQAVWLQPLGVERRVSPRIRCDPSDRSAAIDATVLPLPG